MKIRILTICCLLAFLCTSCMKIILSKTGILSTKVKLYSFNFKGKEVHMLGMRHIGVEEYYKTNGKIIDSFQNLGFKVFAEEGDSLPNQAIKVDSLAIKKTMMLLRLNSKYENNLVVKKLKKFNLKSQTDMKFNKDSILVIDYNMSQLIAMYEKENGEIVLTECNDLKTKNSGNCNMVSKTVRDNYVEKYLLQKRNELVATTVKQAPYKKILIIYGDKHYKGIAELLEKNN